MIAGRAKLVKEMWDTDSGSMMAVEADESDVKNLLAEGAKVGGESFAAAIACYNGPRSFTLAGPIKSIDVVTQMLKTNSGLSGMKNKRLDVSNAFHSTLVDPLMDDREKLAKDMVFKAPVIPFERATETETTSQFNARFVATHM
jgi:acyl transferase domain-containing protein